MTRRILGTIYTATKRISPTTPRAFDREETAAFLNEAGTAVSDAAVGSGRLTLPTQPGVISQRTWPDCPSNSALQTCSHNRGKRRRSADALKTPAPLTRTGRQRRRGTLHRLRPRRAHRRSWKRPSLPVLNNTCESSVVDPFWTAEPVVHGVPRAPNGVVHEPVAVQYEGVSELLNCSGRNLSADPRP